jgi:hypothetical protein
MEVPRGSFGEVLKFWGGRVRRPSKEEEERIVAEEVKKRFDEKIQDIVAKKASCSLLWCGVAHTINMVASPRRSLVCKAEPCLAAHLCVFLCRWRCTWRRLSSKASWRTTGGEKGRRSLESE